MQKESSTTPCDCTSKAASSSCGGPGLEMLPMYQPPEKDEPCCGPPAGPPSSPYEKPGYMMCPFVDGFISTVVGHVPRVRTSMDGQDWIGTFNVRMGFGRNDYKVAPGLYAVGNPDKDAPVLVTANYKLSFDHVRRHLSGSDIWILVLDTRGINVWCAAGKGTFGTDELVHRVKTSGLSQLVDHRRLIVPQLGATGVAAHKVKKGCGFEVKYGPVQARDIKPYLDAGREKDEAMTRVTFTLSERLVLVPVEVTLLRKYLLWTLALSFVLSGIGPSIFSLQSAWQRGVWAMAAVVAGIVAGCVVVPALLPWIPGRSFALKGIITGVALGVLLALGQWAGPNRVGWAVLALILLTMSISSFLAMNFTGSTPFTSPSGVEKEMRRYIPVQLAVAVTAVVVWIVAAFV